MTISPRGLASTSADYGGVLCFLVFALALALASPLSASPLRGISPRDEKYFMGPVIACRDGSATFPKDRLNDGFCDCPDGTDEPGTSACPESKFYCRNMGDATQFLYSSRVNDHICDCCDGSDEYESGVQCPNTCHKDQNASENSTVTVNPESNGLDDLNRQSRNTRIDLIENLIKNIRELMAVIAMQMIVCAIVMVVFCCHHYRHNRIRRKGYFLSRSRGGATTISSLVVASLNAFGATASCLISCHENPSFVLSFLYISR